MQDKKVFIDTNLWVYLLLISETPGDKRKRDKVKFIIEEFTNITISAQVLNEITNVLIRKYKIGIEEIKEYFKEIGEITDISFLTDKTTFDALSLIEKYSLSFYDALIVSSAMYSDCEILYSEDMQDGLIIENKLEIVNPFK